MQAYARVLGIIFGVLMILLSFAVTAETLLRKIFSVSLGGIDELSGYAIAVAAPLAFTVALVHKSHIRINQVAKLLPRSAQAVLDVLAILSLAVLSGYFFFFTVQTVMDTRAYQTIAQTPWATPLIYPQVVWLVASATFPIAALVLAVQALRFLTRRDWTAISRRFGTISADEELQAELDDIKKREGVAS
ncbi:TRAP transporter small permease [Mesorhizobium microcysteis]|uniref:TRAP transporter small permease protein n=1 Tax=Neoaquamicrobium microcysteis TaxID=2682781 RepID=A0A5D4H5T9_9HYPH|nr:TRAP transporter small permease [Mesorhizobium microcysteis]TYR35642.1 TRAP transporter small permease [Mesorhizobium microcysteis]